MFVHSRRDLYEFYYYVHILYYTVVLKKKRLKNENDANFAVDSKQWWYGYNQLSKLCSKQAVIFSLWFNESEEMENFPFEVKHTTFTTIPYSFTMNIVS